MTIYDWINDFERRVRASQDSERIRLTELLKQFWPTATTSVSGALAIVDEGRALAERLDEPWWVMLFVHWRFQVLINDERSSTGALEPAIRGALEVRKPIYQDFPQRICLQEDMIAAFIASDAAGHATAIQAALAYMHKETPTDRECFVCILEHQTAFRLALDQVNEARAAALNFLERCQLTVGPRARARELSLCYNQLCEIAYRLADWTELEIWANAGSEAAGATNGLSGQAIASAWGAVVQRHLGKHDAAGRAFLRANATAARAPGNVGGSFYLPICAYHELNGDLALAIKVRERQLVSLIGRGNHTEECEAQLERCRLRAALGQLTDADLADARASAAKLKDPLLVLAKLDAVAGSISP